MSAPKNGDKPSAPLPTRTKIPGGEAQWWKPEELPIVKEREIEIAGMKINRIKLKALVSAREVDFADGKDVTADDIAAGELAVLSDSEARALVAMTDIAIWAYLKSWTLTERVPNPAGEGYLVQPLPLPESAADVPYLPKNIYGPLSEHANKLVNGTLMQTESFEPNPDEESPTPVLSV